ncbi:PLAC8-domain-containing protein [Choiromyces venosus 120613-1]|uniref:PLAC8-domain-containing protein n=1 Tax=Choiromyces venosus 120613-1 TaxID=1336337 RepID=A0A3N4JWK8_9PEZI|nr:PLAC8-domain-containing protein [Choiromyces venosus 120613-1]
MAQRPYSTLHSPDDVHRLNQAQVSQYSLHTPTDVISPHSFRTSPPPPHQYQQQQPHHLHAMDTTEYQLTDYPSQPHQQQPQQQQEQQSDPRLQQPPQQQQQQQQRSYVASPTTPTSPRFSSPPPAFDSQYPDSRTHISPPTSPTFAPPPTSESSHPVPTTINNSLPVPPEPIQAPTYNPSHDTPHTLKAPVYTPGGGSGPNGGVHAPGQIGHPNQQHGREDYHHGLCDCFSDFSTCCAGYWCPCILYSRTNHRLKTSPNSNLNDFHSCNGHCITFCVLGPISSGIFTTLQRTRIREKYRLEGSLASDCGKAYCCVMCTLVQDEREVRDREDERRRFSGPGSGVVGEGGYRRQETMVYGSRD